MVKAINLAPTMISCFVLKTEVTSAELRQRRQSVLIKMGSKAIILYLLLPGWH